VGFWPYLRSGPRKIFIFFENILHKITFLQLFVLQEKVRKKLFLAKRESKTARSARQKQTHAKLVKSARNRPEIRQKLGVRQKKNACQTTFKSARTFQILRRKPLSGNNGD
jgi:hypothetical protein